MIWQKDRLRPTQPYFIFDTENFRQEVYLKQGISHFYTFKNAGRQKLRVVPDGCIDIFFIYSGDGMECFVCGTVLEYTEDSAALSRDVFGVRFMPGVLPAVLNVKMSELVNSRARFEEIAEGDIGWLKEMAKETDFRRRIDIFLKAYNAAEEKKEKPFGKGETVQAVKKYVYDSDGRIRISQIAAGTGYSERYINRIFMEEMGFSPKTFCKIIQFQHSLEYLNNRSPGRMTEAAVELGYYDQPQFIRNFRLYAGITPKKYLNMIKGRDHAGRVTGENTPE